MTVGLRSDGTFSFCVSGSDGQLLDVSCLAVGFAADGRLLIGVMGGSNDGKWPGET